MNEDFKHIAVEGLPGSGHNRLALIIAEQFEYHPELESNWFDPFSTDGPAESALSEHLRRLVWRFEHQKSLIKTDMFRQEKFQRFLYSFSSVFVIAAAGFRASPPGRRRNGRKSADIKRGSNLVSNLSKQGKTRMDLTSGHGLPVAGTDDFENRLIPQHIEEHPFRGIFIITGIFFPRVSSYF